MIYMHSFVLGSASVLESHDDRHENSVIILADIRRCMSTIVVIIKSPTTMLYLDYLAGLNPDVILLLVGGAKTRDVVLVLVLVLWATIETHLFASTDQAASFDRLIEGHGSGSEDVQLRWRCLNDRMLWPPGKSIPSVQKVLATTRGF
jgi:hypothetical protein